MELSERNNGWWLVKAGSNIRKNGFEQNKNGRKNDHHIDAWKGFDVIWHLHYYKNFLFNSTLTSTTTKPLE